MRRNWKRDPERGPWLADRRVLPFAPRAPELGGGTIGPRRGVAPGGGTPTVGVSASGHLTSFTPPSTVCTLTGVSGGSAIFYFLSGYAPGGFVVSAVKDDLGNSFVSLGAVPFGVNVTDVWAYYLTGVTAGNRSVVVTYTTPGGGVDMRSTAVEVIGFTAVDIAGFQASGNTTLTTGHASDLMLEYTVESPGFAPGTGWTLIVADPSGYSAIAQRNSATGAPGNYSTAWTNSPFETAALAVY